MSHAVTLYKRQLRAGRALSVACLLVLAGCAQTASSTAQSNGTDEIISGKVPLDVLAVMAEAETPRVEPLVRAVEAVTPDGVLVAYANGVDINQPVMRLADGEKKEQLLLELLRENGLKARIQGKLVYIERASGSVASSAMALSAMAGSITPASQVKSDDAARLMPATLMSTPVLAGNERLPASTHPIDPAPDQEEDVPAPAVAAAPAAEEATDSVQAVEPASGSESGAEETVLASTSSVDAASPAAEAPSVAPVDLQSTPAAPAVVDAPKPEVAAEPAATDVSASEKPASVNEAPAVVDAPKPEVAAKPAAAYVSEGDVPVPAPHPEESVDHAAELAAEKANAASDISASAGVASDPAPLDGAATHGPVWSAERGATLHTILEGWCAKAGVQLVWDTEFDFPLAASITFNDSFENAVRTLLVGFGGASPQPVGRLHRQGNTGQQVLVVETRGNIYEDQ